MPGMSSVASQKATAVRAQPDQKTLQKTHGRDRATDRPPAEPAKSTNRRRSVPLRRRVGRASAADRAADQLRLDRRRGEQRPAQRPPVDHRHHVVPDPGQPVRRAAQPQRRAGQRRLGRVAAVAGSPGRPGPACPRPPGSARPGPPGWTARPRPGRRSAGTGPASTTSSSGRSGEPAAPATGRPAGPADAAAGRAHAPDERLPGARSGGLHHHPGAERQRAQRDQLSGRVPRRPAAPGSLSGRNSRTVTAPPCRLVPTISPASPRVSSSASSAARSCADPRRSAPAAAWRPARPGAAPSSRRSSPPTSSTRRRSASVGRRQLGRRRGGQRVRSARPARGGVGAGARPDAERHRGARSPAAPAAGHQPPRGSVRGSGQRTSRNVAWTSAPAPQRRPGLPDRRAGVVVGQLGEHPQRRRHAERPGGQRPEPADDPPDRAGERPAQVLVRPAVRRAAPGPPAPPAPARPAARR